jgi:rod shape-determining protein MreC
MERLFVFIYQYRAFFTFIVLEVFCFWLIVENNQYQSAKFYNSSNALVASLNSFSQGIRDYFLLSEVNRALADENASLREELERDRQVLENFRSLNHADTSSVKRFEFISAKVVNNQVDRFKNFITINQGRDAGVSPGMAVISPLGAVGKVKLVSNRYSVVTSLLNIDMMVSAVLKRTGHFGSIQWDGRSPDETSFKFIPRHVKPVVGDTIITSGYNAVFPEGIMIGTIADVKLRDEALSYDITVSLSQDFRKLSFVTVVKSHLKHEQDSLEQKVLELVK